MVAEQQHACIHSSMEPDCIGCWEGRAWRCQRAYDELRTAAHQVVEAQPSELFAARHALRVLLHDHGAVD